MRRQAYAACRGVVVANGERDGRLAAVERLAPAVEELKLLIRMGKEVHAFASFREFERTAELAGFLRSLRRMRRPHVLVLERGYLKNRIQAPGVPFALVARTRSRHRPRGRAVWRDAITRRSV